MTNREPWRVSTKNGLDSNGTNKRLRMNLSRFAASIAIYNGDALEFVMQFQRGKYYSRSTPF